MAGPAARTPHVDCDPSRVEELFQAHQCRVWRQTDRVFGALMVAQWAFAILVAVVWSPYGWAGKQHAMHLHVQVAVLMGGVLVAFPLAMIAARPGAVSTRMTISGAQMLWSALLIHLSGGRIETHFHVFGSLAFLAFYRDWRVLVPASVVVVCDHLVRGIYWPESVYGIVNPEWWRFLEHAGWVVFEDVVLALACLRVVAEMREMAEHQALVEARQVALGRLAASVAHELRNPLAAVKSAAAYLAKTVEVPAPGTNGSDRSAEFIRLIDRETEVCSAILSDLIEYAREKPLLLGPCSLHSVVNEAIARVKLRPGKALKITNAVPHDLSPPVVDRDQFRRVLTILVQNAVDAFPKGRDGQVALRATGSAAQGWSVSVSDDGDGIPVDALPHVFEPLVANATSGTSTGLGLAIVAAVVKRHRGRVEVDSASGRGTVFKILLPQAPGTRPEPERSASR